MSRRRVSSFMSHFHIGVHSEPTPSPSPPQQASPNSSQHNALGKETAVQQRPLNRPATPPSSPEYESPVSSSPPHDSPPKSPASIYSASGRQTRQRSSSRPVSMIGGYLPPVMDINEDTIPELLPIFSLLNNHQNKLYQEGYFLKLDDQNTQGKANADRTWTECFAQLVGTVLSLWDAAELDAAGEEGEVLPKFINLTDASLKMVNSLPTRSNDEQPLQNILSLSTAGKNRYLLHFNSHHSLVQWTAAIRLAMFEHAALQEAYTGALIAGKARTINNINVIMERNRFQVQDWVRVRFGAGVPWRRCWCVISPPDEKEVAKMQKEMKKKSPYDRSHTPVLKGDIKFYDQKVEGKKQKKMTPIASIHDAYTAFAIYPQAKSLVDASTLIKIEGNVSIHTDPPSMAEGFVFIMPETRPMVSGFETMLRFLFPTWDTFGLYGRPGKLVASTLDSRSLMFAMPKHKKYGYLELLDVSGLIVDKSSSSWDEREWHRQLREATGKRMNDVEDGVKTHARSGSNQSARLSYGNHSPDWAGRPKVGFADDSTPTRGSRSFSLSASASSPGGLQTSPQRKPVAPHLQDRFPSNSSSDSERINQSPVQELGGRRSQQTPEPVSRPPVMNHGPQGSSTLGRPNSAYHSPELRRANSRLSSTTLAQLAKAGGVNLSQGDMPRAEGLNPNQPPRGPGFQAPPPLNLSVNTRSRSPAPNSPYGSPNPQANGPNSPRPSTSSDGRRSPYPPGGPRSPLPLQGRGGFSSPSQQGRGGPPLPNGPPGTAYGRGRGGPPGGPAGRGGYPGQLSPGANQMPQRFPLDAPSSPYRDSVTPNVIIDHYTDKEAHSRPPMPPPHQARAPTHFTPEDNDEDRPRMGRMKTVGGGDDYNQPPPHRPGYAVPDVNFGPTINYGAAPASPRGPTHPSHLPPPPGGGGMASQRPSTPQGREVDRPPVARQRSDYGEQPPRTVAWNPAGQPYQQGPGGLSAQDYVQQRAAAPSPYAHGRSPSGGSMRSGAGDPRAGQSHGQGPPGSFSRPMPSPGAGQDPRFMAPSPQYSSRPTTPSSPRGPPVYQGGQAF